VVQLGDHEQDAIIALMEHFRFYLQYWGTVLVALAAGFLSIVQLRSSLGSLGLTILLMDLVLWQAGYAVLMMVLHGKLCEEVVTKKTEVQSSTDGTPPM